MRPGADADRETSSPTGGLRVLLGPAEHLQLRVTLDPVPSAITALVALLNGIPTAEPRVGASTRVLLAAGSAPPPDLRAAMTSSVVPVALSSLYPDQDHTLSEHRDYLHSTATADSLVADLAAQDDETVGPGWTGPRGSAAAWMHSYSDVVLGLTGSLDPRWQRASGALRREVERIGTAVVRGTVDTLLASLHPRTGWDGEALLVPDRFAEGRTTEIDARGRRLLLVPRIDGADLVGNEFDGRPDCVFLSYPVPGLTGTRADDPARDHLSELLTPQRARLLRALARPRTMGELAGLLQLAPSSVTHHCGRLEAAGIVVRERRGQHVRVGRTAHGDALVDRCS